MMHGAINIIVLQACGQYVIFGKRKFILMILKNRFDSTEHTLSVCYKDKLGNAVSRNNLGLVRESHVTHKDTVWEVIPFMLK